MRPWRSTTRVCIARRRRRAARRTTSWPRCRTSCGRRSTPCSAGPRCCAASSLTRRAREYACDAIERSARAQARLLEQLLDVSRAISGKLDLHLAAGSPGGHRRSRRSTPCGPTPRTRRCGSRAASIAASRCMVVDAERLQQVVVNVVANAVKFSAEDGVIQVELRRDDRVAEVVVEDHGVGIKREFLPYVFDRFRQAAHEIRQRESWAGSRHVDRARHRRAARGHDYGRERRRRQGRDVHSCGCRCATRPRRLRSEPSECRGLEHPPYAVAGFSRPDFISNQSWLCRGRP